MSDWDSIVAEYLSDLAPRAATAEEEVGVMQHVAVAEEARHSGPRAKRRPPHLRAEASCGECVAGSPPTDELPQCVISLSEATRRSLRILAGEAEEAADAAATTGAAADPGTSAFACLLVSSPAAPVEPPAATNGG